MKKALLFTMRFLIKAVFILITLALVGLGILFWRLSEKPLDLEFLMPEIQKVILPENTPLRLEADSVMLSAAFNRNGLFHISVHNLALLGKGDVLILDVPKIEASYGLRNLLTLNYKPISVMIDNMLLQMILTRQQHLLLQGQSNEEEIAMAPVKEQEQKSLVVQDIRKFLRQFLSFRRIQINNASVIVFDEKNGRRIMVPDLDLVLKRQRFSQYLLNIDTDIRMQRDKMHLSGKALMSMGAQTIGFDVAFDKVNLAKAERVIPLLGGVQLVIQGQIKGILDLAQWGSHWRKAFRDLTFAVKTIKPGSVTLPAPLNTKYAVKYLEADGVFADNLESLTIKPIAASLTSGLSADADINVSSIGAFLDSNDFGTVKTVLNARMKNIPIEEVPSVWPAYLGPDAHEWVSQNLKNGRATNALFMLEFTGAELSDLKGDVDFKDVLVRYLSPMKPVQKAFGKVMLYPDRVEIFAQGGYIDNMKLNTANVYLTDLQDDIAHAKIEIDATGPAPEVLALINEKPLELLEGFHIDPAQTGGAVAGQVKLAFPLTQKLTVRDVKADITASISDGSINMPDKDIALNKGALGLVVNNDGLTVQGAAYYKDLPIDVVWKEFFSPSAKKPVKRIYEAKGQVDDVFFKPYYENITDYFIGKVKGSVSYEEKTDKTALVKVAGDLTNAELMLYPFAYTKVNGVPSQADLTIALDKHGAFTQMDFALNADKKAVDIKGVLNISGDRTQITLQKAQAPGTDFAGHLSFIPQKELILSLKGKEWLLTEIKNIPYFKEKAVAPPIKPQTNVMPMMDIDVSMDSITLKAGMPLKQMAIKAQRQNSMWENLFVFVKGKEATTVSFTPAMQKVEGVSYNTGDLLERLNLTSDFDSGRAKLSATQQANGTIKGEIKIKKMDLKDPGFITQAMTILGIIDAFRGKELNFSDGSVPFELAPNFVMTITDGALYGTSLGITFEGLVGQGFLDLTGSVIPAYALNSLPGKIPLIGGLFRDSAHGGLVGVNYSIKGVPSTAEIDFHPLSSIAPGILGRLFK